MDIGPHCEDPYGCPLQEQCWAFLPENNVLTLYRGKKKGFELLKKGITHLKDVPPGTALTENQAIQHQASISGQAHVDKGALRAFLAQLNYPLYLLDFETIGTAIPLFPGVRPYQQVPFQFSLHVLREEDGKPAHHMLLAQGQEDPRPDLLKQLRSLLGNRGSVVAYNAKFEENVLAECCEAFPEYASWFYALKPRVVDLLAPFRSFHFYHPKQEGSASIKAVLPALIGKSYEDLEIRDGNTAAREFIRVTYGEVPEDERQRVRRQLELYCRQDTEGMIWILRALRALVR